MAKWKKLKAGDSGWRGRSTRRRKRPGKLLLQNASALRMLRRAAHHWSKRRQVLMQVRLAPGMQRPAMRLARHLLRKQTSHPGAVAIPISCQDVLWRIA